MFFRNLIANPLFPKLKSWFILLGVTGISQVLVQVLGLISGIMVIRVLPTSEYALYTIANSMLGSMVVLSNGGISSGVRSQSSKVWRDREKVGEVMATGLNLRKKFSFIGIVICLPILAHLLYKNQASWLSIILIIASLIPAFIASLSNSLLSIVPYLHQDVIPVQKNQVGVNIGRLVLLGLFIFIFPFAYIAILASGASQILGNFRLRKITEKYADLNQESSPVVRTNILKIVKRMYPEAVYYSFSGQITIWILSIFGSTTSLAQIGALGRIAVVLSLIPMVFSMLITPRFARLADDFQLLLKRFYTLIMLILAIFIIIIILTALIPHHILWVLGPKYENLEQELVLLVIGSSLSLGAGMIYKLYSDRGWVQHPIMSISISVITLVLGIIIVDVSTLHGVLWLNIITGLSQLLTHGVYGFYKIYGLSRAKSI